MPATIEAVRLLIPDATEPYIFSDTEIQAFIDLVEDGNAYLAAASAVDAIATKMAITYIDVRTDDLAVNASRNADALFKRAQQLREQGEDALGEGFVLVFPEGNKRCRCVPEATAAPYCGC